LNNNDAVAASALFSTSRGGLTSELEKACGEELFFTLPDESKTKTESKMRPIDPRAAKV
jgi:hypothetical protein